MFHTLLTFLDRHLDVVLCLQHECLDINRLVTKVSDGCDSAGEVSTQVLEVLFRSLVLRITHLDGSSVDQLRGQVLDLVAREKRKTGNKLSVSCS